MTERYSPHHHRHVRRQSESQYEDIGQGYAEARRRLYPYEVPPGESRKPYNIWEDIADHLEPKNKKIIAEFGTNDGYFHSVLRHKGFDGRFIGIDIEKNGLESAEYLAQLTIERLVRLGRIDGAEAEAKFLHGDAQDLRGLIATSSVPAVAANFVAYHAERPYRILSEMHRILEPGGIGAISSRNVSNQRDIWEVTRWLAICHGFAFPQELDARGNFIKGVPIDRISVYSHFDIDQTRRALQSSKKFRILHEHIQDTELYIPTDDYVGINDLELVVESLLPYTVKIKDFSKPTSWDIRVMFKFLNEHMKEFFIVNGFKNQHELGLPGPFYISHATQGFFIVEAIK